MATKWTNGKRTITGCWWYNWASDHFVICLNSRDHITGQLRQFIHCGETPEWGNWKLVDQETVFMINLAVQFFDLSNPGTGNTLGYVDLIFGIFSLCAIALMIWQTCRNKEG